MLKIEVEIEASGAEDAQLQLEHIAGEIAKGYWAGEGWKVTGEAEDDEEEE